MRVETDTQPFANAVALHAKAATLSWQTTALRADVDHDAVEMFTATPWGGITSTLPTSGPVEAGVAYVRSERLARLLRRSDALSVVVTSNGVRVGVEAGPAALSLLNAEEPPAWTPDCPPGTPGLRVKARWLASVLKPALFSIGHDETRRNLMCVQIEAEGIGSCVSTIRAVTTDGHRLTTASIGREGGETAAPLLIGGDALRLALRLCATHDEVTLTRGEKHTAIGFLGDDGVSHVIFDMDLGERFPEWRKVIAQVLDGPVRGAFHRRDLGAAVDRCAAVFPVRRSNQKLVRMSLNGHAEWSAESEEQRVSVRVAAETDGEIVCGMNLDYMRDMLRGVPGNAVRMEARDQYTPTRWFGHAGGLDVSVYIMPMRIG